MTKEDRLKKLQALFDEEQAKVTEQRELLNNKVETIKALDQECRQIQNEIIITSIRLDLRKEDLDKAINE